MTMQILHLAGDRIDILSWEYTWGRGKLRRSVAASPWLVLIVQQTEPHASEAAAIQAISCW